IGREMHVIVGQGQLDAILHATPEDRRGFIEEAAGVLKHRKRKDKALRKLDAMQANLARLGDLTAELRRQLKPLGRQAEVARRAQTVQADLRDSRLRLAADDLVTRRAELAGEQVDEAAARDQQARVGAELSAAEAALAGGEAALAELIPAAQQAQDTWFRLSALTERLGATVRVATDRARHLAATAGGERPGRDPDELDAEAERAGAAETELAAVVRAAETELIGAQAARTELEKALATADKQHLAAVRAVADRREGLARLAGQVDTVRTRTESRSAEIERLAAGLAQADERGRAARAELESVQEQVNQLDAGETGLDESHESALAAQDAAAGRVAELAAAERVAEQEVASGRARVEALRVGLHRRDGAAWLLTHGSPGVLGAAAQLLQVEGGYEVAVAAALGSAADALVVETTTAAVGALRALKDGDGGRAGLLVGGGGPAGPATPVGPAPVGRWVSDLVTGPPALTPAMDALLAGVVVVADLDAAEQAMSAGVRGVTMDGDLVGSGWAAGGSDRTPSTLEVQAAVDAATEALTAGEERLAVLDAALSGARADQAERADAVGRTLSALNSSDAVLAAVAEQLGTLAAAARSADAEVARLDAQRATLEARSTADAAELVELEQRLHEAQREPGEHEPSTDDRDQLAARLATARAAEVEARLEQRSATERARAQTGRAEQLRRSARTERDARARAEAAQRSRARAAEVAVAVSEGGQRAQQRLAEFLARASTERELVTGARTAAEQQLAASREQVRGLTQQLATLTDVVHREEVARAEAALRIEALETSIAEQLGIGLDELVAEYGPDVSLPPSAAELTEYELAHERGEQVSAPAPLPYDRAAQQRRLAAAEKDLALLGRVNPLALEEFAALEERHQFLATQLQDVKDTRRDLLGVVADVDARILEVFTAAYTDVAAEFTGVFETLFPGGEGRLVLTDPDNMLTTGIEVEARPPGKKVKRLSLLSGGEKSLTAVAMLVAIFRARPSPFYVMDEVEAALDDTNLQRLITLFAQLRERSQLIVITHQKATMEVADALYGVSMRGDGITTVISQRMRGVDQDISQDINQEIDQDTAAGVP
ncbi:MAG: chromosome segregation protein SMC, partial [Mycobacteriaceae bacterium]